MSTSTMNLPGATTRRKRGARLASAAAPTAGMLPMVVWLGLFFVGPMSVMTVYSFWQVHDFRLEHLWTLRNYRQLFEDPLVYKSFLLSLRLSLIATAINVCIAFPLAWFIARRAGRAKLFCLMLVILPFWTSFILRGYAWKLLLGNQGALNKTLQFLHLTHEPVSAFLYSPFATTIGLIYVYLPLMVLPLYTALEKLNESLLEAAADLGAPTWRRFLEVILPAAAPGLAVGAAFTFVFAMGEYVIPQLLGGGKSLLFGQTIVLQIQANQDYPAAAAMSLALTVLTLGLIAIVGSRVKLERLV